mmetsp:Transcript_37879/g.100804  ORF Transcript_37879/g.100804 Transcript_37879/m.100804 type:complete len:111 (+) Transcript_37879:1393-1725(+)
MTSNVNHVWPRSLQLLRQSLEIQPKHWMLDLNISAFLITVQALKDLGFCGNGHPAFKDVEYRKYNERASVLTFHNCYGPGSSLSGANYGFLWLRGRLKLMLALLPCTAPV